ncbi:GtrA family protein [Paenibacillus sp. RC67]|uniref:GtrA family protein n=1 Tax=Paenibacillus sp. RC67 TaxID=3039392 RepID=UPI0024AD9B85|nr:GtrA family protein [Paenibacillus sp. RC67]
MTLKKELGNYIFFGILTTVVNIVMYALLTKSLIVDYKIATAFAWLVSVIFAFITNKLYVFKSYNNEIYKVIKEILFFIFFRILSLIMDLLVMMLMVQYLMQDDFFSKIISNILVVATNYLFSKFIIFSKKSI